MNTKIMPLIPLDKHLKSILSSFYITASKAEKEVERFFKSILKGSQFEGKVKAVGGYVRDEYLSQFKKDPSIEADDLDIVVDMKGGSEKFTKHLHKILNGKGVSEPKQMGKSHSIWQLVFSDDIEYEGEKYKTKGAKIDFSDPMKKEEVPGTLDEDIKRRDLTVNSLLKDMTTGDVQDLTGVSKSDIEQGVLRGHPLVSLDGIFKDSPSRMLRLVRFQSKYDWDVPRSVLKTIKRNAPLIESVDGNIIEKELKKIAEYGKFRQAIKLMSASGLLKYILPEVEALKGSTQSEDHHQEGDVYRHTLKVLENAGPGVDAQLAALFHDIGKPETREEKDNKITFYKHDDSGGDIAKAILKRLKFDNKTQDRVKTMVQNHMRPLTLMSNKGEVTTKAIRRFIREVGDDLVDSVLDLARSDELGSIPSSNNIPELRKKIDEVRKIKVQKTPSLDGNEIKETLGIKEGPAIGQAKKLLLEIEDDLIDQGKELDKEVLKKELKKKFNKQASGGIMLTPVSDLLRIKFAKLCDIVEKLAVNPAKPQSLRFEGRPESVKTMKITPYNQLVKRPFAQPNEEIEAITNDGKSYKIKYKEISDALKSAPEEDSPLIKKRDLGNDPDYMGRKSPLASQQGITLVKPDGTSVKIPESPELGKVIKTRGKLSN